MGRVCSVYIDASSDPTKFQDDWPSGSPLIGAWSLAFAPNVLVESGTTCQVDFFRPKVDFNDYWPSKSIQRVNISTSLANLKKIGQLSRSHSHFRPIT